MNNQKAKKIFSETEALLEGHFILTSGRHSPAYFQCAKVLQYPKYLSLFAQEIAHHFDNETIDTVVSPAIGGIVIGTEVGRQLGIKTIFAERKDGAMTIRRGFDIRPGDCVLVVEDVITTGGSVKEVMTVCEKLGAKIMGVGVVVDRSNGKARLHPNQYAVTQQSAVSYDPATIPPELEKIPIEKPGSRYFPQK